MGTKRLSGSITRCPALQEMQPWTRDQAGEEELEERGHRLMHGTCVVTVYSKGHCCVNQRRAAVLSEKWRGMHTTGEGAGSCSWRALPADHTATMVIRKPDPGPTIGALLGARRSGPSLGPERGRGPGAIPERKGGFPNTLQKQPEATSQGPCGAPAPNPTGCGRA